MFIRRKLVPNRSITRQPELPWGSQLFLHFLTNMANCLHEQQKVGPAGRVIVLARSPFSHERVILPVGPTNIHFNTGCFTHLGWTRTRRNNQSMLERWCQLLAGLGKEVNFFRWWWWWWRRRRRRRRLLVLVKREWVAAVYFFVLAARIGSCFNMGSDRVKWSNYVQSNPTLRTPT